jgi:hypothetical protein
MRKFFAIFAALVFAVSLMACESAEEKKARERTERLAAEFRVMHGNELPSNWQAVVKDALSGRFMDPGSVQYKFLSDPVKRTIDGEERWLLGVDINAKNAFGGYTGFQVWTIVIQNGKVVSTEIMPEDIAKSFRDMSRR